MSHENCFATGWGKDEFEKGDYQSVMKQVVLDMVDFDTCEQKLKQTDQLSNSFFRLHPSFNCAGGKKV